MRLFHILPIVPLMIAWAVRSYLANVAGVSLLDVRTFSEIEIWAYCFCVVLAGVLFWRIFVRPVCPGCKSYAVEHFKTEELGQFHTVRKVRETDNNGRSVTRHLNVTVAERRKYLRCGDCNHKWSIDFKRDKT